MGLIDIFKPKWKHKDSDVRLEAVQELDDQKILVKIAKNDSDKYVRGVAVRKINEF